MDSMSRATLEAISKRNPGALDVCFRLWSHLHELVAFDFEMLVEMNVLGSDLWDLYKACGYDIAQVHASIIERTAIEKVRTIPGSTFWQAAQTSKPE